MQALVFTPMEVCAPLLEELPEEILFHVLSYINCPKDYAVASLVCKSFRRILLDPKLHLFSKMISSLRPHLGMQAREFNPVANPNGSYAITYYLKKDPFKLAAVEGFGTQLLRLENSFDRTTCAVAKVTIRYWPEGGSILNLLEFPIIHVQMGKLERLSTKIKSHLENLVYRAVAISHKQLPEDFQDIPKLAWLSIITDPAIDLT